MPDEELRPETEQSANPRPEQTGERRRHSGRSRRGRGRGRGRRPNLAPDEPASAAPPVESQTIPEPALEQGPVAAPETETVREELQESVQPAAEAPPARKVENERLARPPSPPPPPREWTPAAQTGVKQAIEEVNQIIESLKQTLEDMDEVLETLELAERQKDADEREIETLRRSLRQLQRPRDGGHR